MLLEDRPIEKTEPEVVRDSYSAIPTLSAIVVVPDTYGTVRHIVNSLKTQTVVNQIEIVFVVPPNQQLTIDESDLSCFHSWYVVEVERVKSLGAAYVEGISHAHAPIVALTHDHSFPDANWAEVFITAHQKSWAAVGPGIRNGNPNTIISWADFYLCYGQWAYPVSPGPVPSLPAHHSSYKRDILLACGNQLYFLMEDEYFLYRHLSAQGYKFLLESKIYNTHINLTSWSSWIPSRYYKGRQFAATWAHTWSWPRRLLFTMASPLLPLVRLWRIQNRIRRGQSYRFFIHLLPIISVGLIFEWFGQIMGFIAGLGDSSEKSEKYEFHRLKYEELTNQNEHINSPEE